MPGEWTAQLEGDLKSNEAFTAFATVSDFAKAHLETAGKLKDSDGKVKTFEGKVADLEKNSIRKLPENASEEQKTAFYAALGKPKEAEEYELDVPKEAKLDEKMSIWAKTSFFKHNLNKEQAKGISADFNEFFGGIVKAESEIRIKERGEAETKLKTELGDKYDSSVEMVRRVWKKHSNSEFDAFVNETKIGNDARLIRFMINIAKLTGEDHSPPGTPGKGALPKGGIIYDKSPAPPSG